MRHWHFDCSPRLVQGPHGCALKMGRQDRAIWRDYNRRPVTFDLTPFALFRPRDVDKNSNGIDKGGKDWYR